MIKREPTNVGGTISQRSHNAHIYSPFHGLTSILFSLHGLMPVALCLRPARAYANLINDAKDSFFRKIFSRKKNDLNKLWEPVTGQSRMRLSPVPTSNRWVCLRRPWLVHIICKTHS